LKKTNNSGKTFGRFPTNYTSGRSLRVAAPFDVHISMKFTFCVGRVFVDEKKKFTRNIVFYCCSTLFSHFSFYCTDIKKKNYRVRRSNIVIAYTQMLRFFLNAGNPTGS